MSGSIDDVSIMLGKVSAGIDHLIEKTTIIDDKVEKVRDDSSKHSASIDKTHERLDGVVEDVSNIQSTVDEHEGLKNKGLGALVVISFIFGAIGNAISKVIHGWF